TTDEDGIAYFNDFSIISGAPGLYSFNFSCASSTCLTKLSSGLSQVVNIVVISSVNELQLVNLNTSKWVRNNNRALLVESTWGPVVNRMVHLWLVNLYHFNPSSEYLMLMVLLWPIVVLWLTPMVQLAMSSP